MEMTTERTKIHPAVAIEKQPRAHPVVMKCFFSGLIFQSLE